MFKVMDSDQLGQLGLDKNSAKQGAVNCFDFAIRSAQEDLKAAGNSDGALAFEKQLANRLFNRGLFLSSIEEKARGSSDVKECLALDARVALHDQNDHLATFSKLISRIKGLLGLLETNPESINGPVSVAEIHTLLNAAFKQLSPGL